MAEFEVADGWARSITHIVQNIASNDACHGEPARYPCGPGLPSDVARNETGL